MFEVVKTGVVSSAAPVSGMVRKGPLILTAQIPKDPETGAIIQGDITVQTRRMLENLKIGLAAAGGSLSDVMRCEVFIVDPADAPAINTVWREFFSEPWPCRATVVVKGLLAPSMLIEMTATAWIEEA